MNSCFFLKQVKSIQFNIIFFSANFKAEQREKKIEQRRQLLKSNRQQKKIQKIIEEDEEEIEDLDDLSDFFSVSLNA